MKSYSEREIFGNDELEVYEMATGLIASVPDEVISVHPAWRCHELARAVARFLTKHGPSRNKVIKNFRVVDGHYGRVRHSWIAWAAPEDAMSGLRILDVYCVARLPMVQLVDGFVGTHIDKVYKPGHLPWNDIDEEAIGYLLELWHLNQRKIKEEAA